MFPNKYESPLAQAAQEVIKEIDFGHDRSVRPVSDQQAIDGLKDAGLGLDYRAKTTEAKGHKTVFEGLAFDKEAVRTQCFAIYESDNPIAIMSVAIAPKAWIAEQRYVRLDRQRELVEILDFKGVSGADDFPDFFIIPAWTKVIESHRTKMAMPGYRAIKNIFDLLEREAPRNTLMESIAQGRLSYEEQDEMGLLLDSHPVGTVMRSADLPFSPDLVGRNSSGSSSTVKMARLFGMQQLENVGCGHTLGPVFIKDVK